MPAKIKLCAIAKNEGAYLADWVFHHLHMGFDGVEVWINETNDPSVRIMRRIQRVHPEVSARVVTDMLYRCMTRGKNFQHRAYAGLARRAKQEGFTHVQFLDLDEFWTSRDMRSGIHGFLPEDTDINVVSFPWCLDVPDPTRLPFQHPFLRARQLQIDRHVKSAVRLDDRVRMFRTHTARTTSGRRLLVRSNFPLTDERRQHWGSLLDDEDLRAEWSALPEAFVLHAIHRSQTEYVASLAKGLRQTGSDLPLKINRMGFMPNAAPVLKFEPARQVRRTYQNARAKFLDSVDVAVLTEKSRRLARAQARALLQQLRSDSDAVEQLQRPLQGIDVNFASAC